MAKPCKKGECEECPEWIFTFADLVMLMMGFFVILWVTKPSPSPRVGNGEPGTTASAQDDKWIDTVARIRMAFDYEPKPSSNDPIDQRVKAIRDRTTPAGEKDLGQAALPPRSPVGIADEATAIRPGKQSMTGGRLRFAAGSAELDAAAIATVDQVADVVRGHRYVVLVQGHTALDDLPDEATAMQKLALSLRRAEAVAARLTADGVTPDVLRVVGCSTFEPVVAGVYTPQSQADNRRVEVLTTATLATDVAAGRPAVK